MYITHSLPSVVILLFSFFRAGTYEPVFSTNIEIPRSRPSAIVKNHEITCHPTFCLFPGICRPTADPVELTFCNYSGWLFREYFSIITNCHIRSKEKLSCIG